MGKFFNGKVKNDKEKYIKYGVIAGGVLLIIIIIMMIVANNRKGGNAILTLKESLDVEVGTKLPDKMEYFSEFENFDKDKITVDDSGVDINTVGVYEVTVSAKGLDEADVVVNIVDKTAPTLTIKNLTIASGDYYSAEDFVASCTDNYDDACTVEFYQGAKDQNGNPVDYANYTLDGNYTVSIIAKDESGNETAPQSASLVIGNGGGNTKPTSCLYGDLTVLPSLKKYPLSFVVADTNSNCAVDFALWNNKETQQRARDFYKSQDYPKLKSQLEPIVREKFPNGAHTVDYSNLITIINESTTGLIGYSIYIEVYIVDATADIKDIQQPQYLKAAYYINSDGTRDYDVNVYGLPD